MMKVSRILFLFSCFAVIFLGLLSVSCLAADTTASGITGMLAHASQQNSQAYWYLLFLAFISGVVVSFTPCLYPMIPVTVGILQSQATPSVLRNFFASLTYVLGIASVYAVLGYLSATTSLMFGSWLGRPWFVFLIVLFFLYLAFSMMGFYEIYMPRFLTNRTITTQRGSLGKLFLFGMVSGTIMSPCLTPALAVILSFAAKSAHPVIGFFMLFLFALGMGVLLVLVGTFSSIVMVLPKAGLWMDEVKRIFGFGMLAMCVYFLEPFMAATISTLLYAGVCACASCYYFVMGHGWIRRVFGIISACGAFYFVAQGLVGVFGTR